MCNKIVCKLLDIKRYDITNMLHLVAKYKITTKENAQDNILTTLQAYFAEHYNTNLSMCSTLTANNIFLHISFVAVDHDRTILTRLSSDEAGELSQMYDKLYFDIDASNAYIKKQQNACIQPASLCVHCTTFTKQLQTDTNEQSCTKEDDAKESDTCKDNGYCQEHEQLAQQNDGIESEDNSIVSICNSIDKRVVQRFEAEIVQLKKRNEIENDMIYKAWYKLAKKYIQNNYK